MSVGVIGGNRVKLPITMFQIAVFILSIMCLLQTLTEYKHYSNYTYWLIYLNCMMMHGLTNFKLKKKETHLL